MRLFPHQKIICYIHNDLHMELLMKKTALFILLAGAIIVIIFFIGKLSLAFQFNREVAELFAQSGDISLRRYSENQIADLPVPVQRYFKHVLIEGQPYISTVRLRHNGQFKQTQQSDWVDITGEQYFTTDPPGFIWKGKTSLFTARDMYLSGKGRIIVTLFSLFNIIRGEGPAYDQGELLRWLGESAWFPTNLLPNEHVEWSPIDDQSARLNFDYNGLSLSFLVRFNENNEIAEVETKRYMGEENLQTWVGRYYDYKEVDGILIPARVEAVWLLGEGEHNYARFNIEEIEFDNKGKLK
jgi:hypothetical protein